MLFFMNAFLLDNFGQKKREGNNRSWRKGRNLKRDVEEGVCLLYLRKIDDDDKEEYHGW